MAVPGPGRRRARAPTTTSRSTASCCASPPSRWSCTGSARCSTRRWTGYWGSRPTSTRPPTPSWRSSPPTRTRSTASRCRCSTPSARSHCAAACPQGVRCYTGDDFNYPELIAGDEQGFSHALLGIFDPLAPAAAAARSAPRHRRHRRASARLLDPTVALSRHLFADAHPLLQDRASCSWPGWPATRTHFTMVGGLQSARSPAAPRRAPTNSPTGRACSPTRSWPRSPDARACSPCTGWPQ